MQDASADFETAVTTHRTFTNPRLRTDWDGTGYGGDGTIDDLSGQMAEEWDVDHALDDGYPDTVAFVAGSSVPELTTDVAGRAVSGVPVTGPAYWSVQRIDSPVYAFERDVAPVTFDVGLVTASGQEYARVFTGQMVNTPVRDGQATLHTLSAARLKLMRYVQPPAFPAVYAGGLRAEWPISYALLQCGLGPGPAIRTGCVWHAPMHGSLWRMLPTDNTTGTFEKWNIFERAAGDVDVALDGVDWIPGPYVSAPDLQLLTALSRRAYLAPLRFDDSAGQADALSTAGNVGRVEMWVKGDPTDFNTAPGGSGTVSQLCGFHLEVNTVSPPHVTIGIDRARKVSVVVYDGTNTRTLTSAATLPTDGAWYFVGAAYDFTADKLWVNLGGTAASSAEVMSTAALPTADNYGGASPYFLSYLPCAEVTFTTGVQANPDSYPLWRNDAGFAPVSVVARSSIGLVVSAETQPREAWEFISEYAKAELAMMRPTELDAFEYLPLGWWVRDEQQAVTDLIATDLNAGPVGIDLDPTKIRNSVQVSYTATSIPSFSAEAGQYRIIYALPAEVEIAIARGVSYLTVTLSAPTVRTFGSAEVVDGAQAALVAAGNNATAFCTLNDALDGSGTYATAEQMLIVVDSWDAGKVVLKFTNLTTITWYLANAESSVPALRLAGLPVTTDQARVLEEDTTSITARGPRGIDVSAPILQTEESARRLARNLKMNLRRAVATIGDDSQGITVTGNPLRQPGDLVQIRDAETGITDDLWRLQGVKHKGRGVSYTQQVVARQVFPICIVGDGIVGASLVGPPE